MSTFTFSSLGITTYTVSPVGGIAPVSAPVGVANKSINAATNGTDSTPASGTQYVSSIWIPCNMTIVNINYLIGSVGGTNKVYAVLYDSTGVALASSSVSGSPAGATVGTAANIQTLALTSSYPAIGPGTFFVGISISGNTARIRTIPAFLSDGVFGNTISQTHGTVGNITAPTSFTADQAPYVFVN